MSGMVSKAQIPTMGRGGLPSDLNFAIIDLKNRLKLQTGVKPFWNGKPHSDGQPDPNGKRYPGPSPLPRLDNGCCYYEYDVGKPGHGMNGRGNRRIVAEVVKSTHQIREIYFTDDHYTKGTFYRII